MHHLWVTIEQSGAVGVVDRLEITDSSRMLETKAHYTLQEYINASIIRDAN
jgi:hypothetical protein